MKSSIFLFLYLLTPSFLSSIMCFSSCFFTSHSKMPFIGISNVRSSSVQDALPVSSQNLLWNKSQKVSVKCTQVVLQIAEERERSEALDPRASLRSELGSNFFHFLHLLCSKIWGLFSMDPSSNPLLSDLLL